jgi:hypothetical protein
MREPLSSISAQQWRSCAIAAVVLGMLPPGAGPESCAAAGATSTVSPSLSSSSIGRDRIPLGATEFGGPGLSAAAPVLTPNPPNGASACVLTGTSSAANIGC